MPDGFLTDEDGQILEQVISLAQKKKVGDLCLRHDPPGECAGKTATPQQGGHEGHVNQGCDAV